MVQRLGAQLDQFGIRHPRLMLMGTIGLGVVTVLILIYNTKDTAIVYRAF
jgi:hypothetical protein